jgi:beta-galactosidase GanA
MDTAKANDLKVVLRIGPYICGEYYFGGLPLWLRHVDGATCFRCDDPVWEREMQRIVSIVVAEMTNQLWPNGGPIIMLQIENEYSGNQTYLE